MNERHDIGWWKKKYESWWLGKYCRPIARKDAGFKKVVKIELLGPPSFVYGQCLVKFEDGSEIWLPNEFGAYRPRKKDMDVLDSDKEIDK